VNASVFFSVIVSSKYDSWHFLLLSAARPQYDSGPHDRTTASDHITCHLVIAIHTTVIALWIY